MAKHARETHQLSADDFQTPRGGKQEADQQQGIAPSSGESSLKMLKMSNGNTMIDNASSARLKSIEITLSSSALARTERGSNRFFQTLSIPVNGEQ